MFCTSMLFHLPPESWFFIFSFPERNYVILVVVCCLGCLILEGPFTLSSWQDRDGQATIIALRPIHPGEEVIQDILFNQ